MTYSGLNVLLLYARWFHRALEKLTALGLGLYTRESLRDMVVVWHAHEKKGQRPFSSGLPAPRTEV